MTLSTEVAVANEKIQGVPIRGCTLREGSAWEADRQPPVNVEGHRRLRLSGLTVAWRGTRNLDDGVAYIVTSKSTKLILADRASERKVKTLVSRVDGMLRPQVEKLAKGSRSELETPRSAERVLPLPPSLTRRLSAMHRRG